MPCVVIACTVPTFSSAKTSANPVGLGTAGIIVPTPDPSPGLDQSTVPEGSGAALTVTSADAVPPVIVTCPGPSALRMGGSSVERPTTVGSLDARVSPVTGCPFDPSAWITWVSPTAMLMRLGWSVTLLPPGTVNANALLHTLFCCTRAMPVSEPEATTATTCVSLQLTAVADWLPSQTVPLPCNDPKPVPVIVTDVPAPPDVGLTLVV